MTSSSYMWTGNTSPCQRWRDGATSFRTDEVDPRDLSKYEAVVIAGDNEPRAFVERHHYSRSYPAARFRVGLIRGSEFAGMAIFSHPPSEKVLARLPCERMAGVELGRFILLDDVPGNGESWFLARCFEHLRANGFEALISHSDPVARRALDGSVILPGHVGTIYQATNAVYAGRTKQNLLALLPDGTVFSSRSMSKIRKRERGYRYCIEQLVAAGASAPGSDLMPQEELTAWMWSAIASVCRRVKHAGNHRYVWALDRSIRREVAAMAVKTPDGKTYPKTLDVAA